MQYKHIYGPIPSRRLGISLGVDPIPHKTCPLNCIYCECGATTKFTMERKEYILTESILAEIEHFIDNNPAPDYITFSGSGEPTLHSKIGYMIHTLKQKYPHVKIAVLTNSLMLGDKTLCEELLLADLVAPSLDAVTPSIFRAIDHPMPHVSVENIPHELKNFAKIFLEQKNKELWIEIFVVEGLNDTENEIQQFIRTLKDIPYTQIQLNRLDRLGTVPTLVPASMTTLQHMKDTFLENGLKNVQIVGKCSKRDEIIRYHKTIEDSILESLTRRSLSLEDLESMTGKSIEEIGQYLDVLGAEKKIIVHALEGRVMYRIKNTP